MRKRRAQVLLIKEDAPQMGVQADGRYPPTGRGNALARQLAPGEPPSNAGQAQLARSNAATTSRPAAPVASSDACVCCFRTHGDTPKSPRGFV